MRCKKPYVARGGMIYGCGQCLPCRLNRRRIWTHRIMLEAAQYEDNSFLTLTYDDEHLPPDGSLQPKDAQDWLKRFRKAIEPFRVRYYLVGEYGDASNRPHYHLALFGYPACNFGNSRYSHRDNCCPVCDLVRDTWAKGHVFVGKLETSSAQYIAGYVTKKMTAKDDPRLKGRYPEFARMSLRPGIGADAMHEVASTLMEFNLESAQSDVPSALRHGTRELPLGRYLRRKLRLMVGKDEKISQEAFTEMGKEMLSVLEASKSSPEGLSAKQIVLQKNKGSVQRIEALYRLFKQKREL